MSKDKTNSGRRGTGGEDHLDSEKEGEEGREGVEKRDKKDLEMCGTGEDMSAINKVGICLMV